MAYVWLNLQLNVEWIRFISVNSKKIWHRRLDIDFAKIIYFLFEQPSSTIQIGYVCMGDIDFMFYAIKNKVLWNYFNSSISTTGFSVSGSLPLYRKDSRLNVHGYVYNRENFMIFFATPFGVKLLIFPLKIVSTKFPGWNTKWNGYLLFGLFLYVQLL